MRSLHEELAQAQLERDNALAKLAGLESHDG
jgi:hypothetical protein